MTDDTAQNGLRGKVLHGMAWMVALRWTFKGLGFINILILARLLVPADFGLVSLAMIVVGLVDIWVAFGVDNALIQQRDSTRADYDTAFTLSILQKAVVAGGIVVGTPLAVAYFDEPRLALVLHVLAASIFLSGFANIGVVRFRKELDFRAEFVFNIVPKLVQFVVTVAAAFALRDYWALVIGTVVGHVATVVISYTACDYRPRLTLSCFRRLWSFSQWTLVLGIGNFVLYRADEVVIGGQAGTHQLGLFNMASEIGQLPSTELMAPLNRVLFPAFSLLQDERGRYQAAFLKGLQGIATVLLPVGTGIAMVSADLVPVMLGDKWGEVVPLLSGMAVYGILRGLMLTAWPAMYAVGRVREVALIVWLQGILTVACAVAVIGDYGVIGVVYVKNAVLVMGLAVAYASLERVVGIRILAVLRTLVRPLVASAGMVVVVALTLQALSPGVVRLLACACTGAATYVVLLLALWAAAGRPDCIEAIVWRRLGGNA